MLKRFIVIGILLCVLSSISVYAQEAEYEEACELDSFNFQIDAAILEYINTRQIDTSTDGALASVKALQEELDALYDNCLETQREVRSDDLTTLLDQLYDGGYILYVRHTHTDRVSSGDTDRPGCEAQRNLSTRGRDEAETINLHFADLDLPIGQLISTELCRTLDTAELAFGEPEVIPRAELEETLADVLTFIPEAGTNTIIVAHIGTINRNFGLPIPFDEGDTYVFEPMGDDGFKLVGRIALLDWPVLVEISESLSD